MELGTGLKISFGIQKDFSDWSLLILTMAEWLLWIKPRQGVDVFWEMFITDIYINLDIS